MSRTWDVRDGFSETTGPYPFVVATTWYSPTHAWSWRVSWDGAEVREGRAEVDRRDAQRQAEVLIDAIIAGTVTHPNKGTHERQGIAARLQEARDRARKTDPDLYVSSFGPYGAGYSKP